MKSINLICLSLMAIFSLSSIGYAQSSDTFIMEEQASAIAESITTSVRCPADGIAVGGEFVPSRADISLVEEMGVDCDATGCRAWQMTFASESPESFNVNVKAQCRGLDAVKMQEYLELRPGYLEQHRDYLEQFPEFLPSSSES